MIKGSEDNEKLLSLKCVSCVWIILFLGRIISYAMGEAESQLIVDIGRSILLGVEFCLYGAVVLTLVAVIYHLVKEEGVKAKLISAGSILIVVIVIIVVMNYIWKRVSGM